LEALAKTGFQISGPSGPYCEIWFRTSLPNAAPANKPNVTLGTIAEGVLVGAIRFDGSGADRRGQTIPAGIYTLRYAILPANGSHEGAAPQRDFLLLIPVAHDQNPNSVPKIDDLVAMSEKASGTAHPAVLSIWKADGDATSFSQRGDSDWVFQIKLGDATVAVILVGSLAG